MKPVQLERKRLEAFEMCCRRSLKIKWVGCITKVFNKIREKRTPWKNMKKGRAQRISQR